MDNNIMTDGERPYGLGLSASAWEKRKKQLEAWKNSATNREPSHVVSKSRSTRVKFSLDIMLLAAVSAGDEEEVERLLSQENANVNYKNSDGLTAAHQCCIDDDLSMLKLLVKHGANVNSTDNEGWTPLHAAASCGYDHIVQYLLESGAFSAPVNNEGQTPSDLGEDYEEVFQLLETEIDRKGINVDEIKCQEEKEMLDDAKTLLNNPKLRAPVSTGGATPLHVAAAKNYTTVINVLLSIKGLDIDARDDDGWTALHAAVYWGCMEAAQLLVLRGSNMYARTDTGEELEDLLDPECEEEFAKLRKLNSETRNKRRSQVLSRQRSNSNMHSNTMDGNSKGITSPGLKRRLSKERLSMSKMIDMQKEKADLMHSFERMDEEQNVSNGNNRTDSSPTPSQPLPDSVSNNTDSGYSQKNNSTQSTNDVSTNEIPTHSHSRNNSLTGSGSPKNTRSMSQRMLARLNMFETTGNGSSTTGGSPVPLSPLTTSTPLNSPPVVQHGSLERKKIDSSDCSRTRIGSLDIPQSSVGTQKRFLFQPKPVSSTSSKTMSLDRNSSSLHVMERIPSVDQLQDPSTSNNSSTPSSKTTVSPISTPSVDTSLQSQNTSESSASMRERSVSFVGKDGQAETRRKSAARSKRETRRPTQPVPVDFLQQISQYDKKELKELDTESKKKENITVEKDVSKKQVDGVSKTIDGVVLRESNETVTHREPDSTELPEEKVKEVVPIQSAFRPGVRPASKLINSEDLPQDITTEPPKKSIPVEEKVEKKLDQGLGNELSPQIPRLKSTNRRKPKEKRRSTGIPTEIDDDTEVPECLKGIVHVRQSSGDSTDSNVSGSNHHIIISGVEGVEDSSISAAAIEYYQQEIDKLKKLLNEERNKTESTLTDYRRVCTQIESKDKQIAELHRQCDDINRAYQQEKSDKDQKDKKILQLEKSQKSIHELKAEIQRLKDENGALIRVVGKLSRAPFTA